eukprot:UN26421
MIFILKVLHILCRRRKHPFLLSRDVKVFVLVQYSVQVSLSLPSLI